MVGPAGIGPRSAAGVPRTSPLSPNKVWHWSHRVLCSEELWLATWYRKWPGVRARQNVILFRKDGGGPQQRRNNSSWLEMYGRC